MNDETKFLVGLISGAVLGYALGLLVAPEDGIQLRKKIIAEADNIAQNLIEQGSEIATTALSNAKNK